MTSTISTAKVINHINIIAEQAAHNMLVKIIKTIQAIDSGRDWTTTMQSISVSIKLLSIKDKVMSFLPANFLMIKYGKKKQKSLKLVLQ